MRTSFSKKTSHSGEMPGARFCDTLFELTRDDVIMMSHSHDSWILKLRTNMLAQLKKEWSSVMASWRNLCFKIRRLFSENFGMAIVSLKFAWKWNEKLTIFKRIWFDPCNNSRMALSFGWNGKTKQNSERKRITSTIIIIEIQLTNILQSAIRYLAHLKGKYVIEKSLTSGFVASIP